MVFFLFKAAPPVTVASCQYWRQEYFSDIVRGGVQSIWEALSWGHCRVKIGFTRSPGGIFSLPPTPNSEGQTQKVSTFLFFKKGEKVDFFFFLVSLNYLTMPVKQWHLLPKPVLSLPKEKVVFSVLVGSEITVPKYRDTWKTPPFFYEASDLREGKGWGEREEEGGSCREASAGGSSSAWFPEKN